MVVISTNGMPPVRGRPVCLNILYIQQVKAKVSKLIDSDMLLYVF